MKEKTKKAITKKLKEVMDRQENRDRIAKRNKVKKRSKRPRIKKEAGLKPDAEKVQTQYNRKMKNKGL